MTKTETVSALDHCPDCMDNNGEIHVLHEIDVDLYGCDNCKRQFSRAYLDMREDENKEQNEFPDEIL